MTKIRTATIVAGITIYCANCMAISELHINDKPTGSYTESTAETDSTANAKVTDLKEFVVESEYAWIEADKAVFVPRKNEKNLATDAISLVKTMQIPLLATDNNMIKSRNGSSVGIFINGIPATSSDLQTFWPKNAIRVEYYESPSDPRFQGMQCVVNFIMKEYVAGGLTKLQGKQTIPNSGSYGASSKFVYKKLTLNAVFRGGYSRDHRSGEYSRESFSDIYYGGEHYDRIDRTEKSDDNAQRNDNIYAGINATYTKGNTFVIHEARLQWNRDPGSVSNGSVIYTPGIIDGDIMKSGNHSRALSPYLLGAYSFRPNPKLSIYLDWNFGHTHTNRMATYREGNAEEIINGFKENSYNYGFHANIGYTVTPKFVVAFRLREIRNLYSSYYSGTTASHQWQSSGESAAEIYLWYRPVDRFHISATPILIIKDRNTNHTFKSNEVLPGVELRGQYLVSQRSSLSLYAFYHQSTPAVNATNSLILRETELMWLKGNPDIKSSSAYSTSLEYFIMPTGNLNVLASASWSLHRNSMMYRYYPGDNLHEGIIKAYANAGNEGNVNFMLNANLRLFRGKINLNAQLTYMYMYYTGGLHKSIANWRPKVEVTWYFGNCSLDASFSGRQKSMENGGSQILLLPHNLSLGFNYGNGHLNVGVRIKEPLKDHFVQKSWLNDGPYTKVSSNWYTGRSVTLSLTYTFDYGKKVDPRISISEKDITNTSIIGQ